MAQVLPADAFPGRRRTGPGDARYTLETAYGYRLDLGFLGYVEAIEQGLTLRRPPGQRRLHRASWAGGGHRDPEPRYRPRGGPEDEALRGVRAQMAAALGRLRELEEQVRALPALRSRLQRLQEEKRLLLERLRSHRGCGCREGAQERGNGIGTGSTGIDPGTDPGSTGIDPGIDPGSTGIDPGIDPRIDPGITGIDPGIDPSITGIDPMIDPGITGIDPGTDPGIDPGITGVDPDVTGIDPGIDPGITGIGSSIPRSIPDTRTSSGITGSSGGAGIGSGVTSSITSTRIGSGSITSTGIGSGITRSIGGTGIASSITSARISPSSITSTGIGPSSIPIPGGALEPPRGRRSVAVGTDGAVALPGRVAELEQRLRRALEELREARARLGQKPPGDTDGAEGDGDPPRGGSSSSSDDSEYHEAEEGHPQPPAVQPRDIA